MKNKTLLIPGYGSNIYLNSKLMKKNAGFAECYFDNPNAVLFDWGLGKNFTFFKYVDPFSQFSSYKVEKQLAVSKKTFNEMSKLLETQKPVTIIIHSMGAYLLVNYFRVNKIPDNLERIIFLSADLTSYDLRHFTKNLPDRIKIQNYYCFWDNALLSSLLLNRYLPIGLVGVKDENVLNRFWPQYIGLNLHQSFQKDRKLAKKY